MESTPSRHEAVFVSDIHLDADAPRTAQAFFDFIRRVAPTTRRMYLLGDLFEAWPGDDALSLPFNAQVVATLRAAHATGTELFWMAGNRDFLVGQTFAQAAALTILPDPCVQVLAGQPLVLSHGDVACTDDVAYQAFRSQVRMPAWQQAFLARPLVERLQLIANMREGSRAAQRDKAAAIMDVNQAAIDELFAETGAAVMIHGHTHRPAVHHAVDAAGRERTRHVLTDWDCEGTQSRGGGLALETDGRIVPLSLSLSLPI